MKCPKCGGSNFNIGDSRDFHYFCKDCKEFVWVANQHNSEGKEGLGEETKWTD